MRTIRTLLVAASLAATALVVAGLAAPNALGKDKDVEAALEKIEKNAKETFEQRQRESAIRALGKLGGKEAAAALLPLMDDPYVHIRDHVWQAWTAMLAGARAAETREWMLERGLKDRRAHVRAALWKALSEKGAEKGAEKSAAELEDALRKHAKSEKDAVVLRALAEAAVAIDDGADLSGVFVPRFSHRDGATVHALAQAAARYDGQAAVAPLGKLLTSRDPLARAGAVVALQRLDALSSAQVAGVLADAAAPPRMALAETLHLRTKSLGWPGAGAGALDVLLAADDWRVRAAAVQAALRLWEPGIVERLIGRLEVEDGRLKDDVHRALVTFTGHAPDVDADLWKAWWAARGEGFDPGERPELDTAGRVPFADGATGAGKGATASFFDMPLYSKKILFIFDLSGSLANAAHDGENAPTKIELLRQEVRKTLDSFGEDVSFDLCVYRYWSGYPPAPEMTRAFGKLAPAKKRSLQKAKKWLEGEDPKGWGAFVEPLEECYLEDIDTAILLSDGRPSRGRYEKDFRILAEFPRINRYHALAVNTVLIGAKGADKKFMQRLSSLTGGHFREGKAESQR